MFLYEKSLKIMKVTQQALIEPQIIVARELPKKESVLSFSLNYTQFTPGNNAPFFKFLRYLTFLP